MKKPLLHLAVFAAIASLGCSPGEEMAGSELPAFPGAGVATLLEQSSLGGSVSGAFSTIDFGSGTGLDSILVPGGWTALMEGPGSALYGALFQSASGLRIFRVTSSSSNALPSASGQAYSQADATDLGIASSTKDVYGAGETLEVRRHSYTSASSSLLYSGPAGSGLTVRAIAAARDESRVFIAFSGAGSGRIRRIASPTSLVEFVFSGSGEVLDMDYSNALGALFVILQDGATIRLLKVDAASGAATVLSSVTSTAVRAIVEADYNSGDVLFIFRDASGQGQIVMVRDTSILGRTAGLEAQAVEGAGFAAL